jgi:hypothetical protein
MDSQIQSPIILVRVSIFHSDMFDVNAGHPNMNGTESDVTADETDTSDGQAQESDDAQLDILGQDALGEVFINEVCIANFVAYLIKILSMPLAAHLGQRLR